MARKGNRKVRTGCLTCKIRKVKCDEAKPCCERCINTGRKCDGYPVLPSAKSTVSCKFRHSISLSTGPRKSMSAAVSRSLHYFHHTVAPALSGYRENSFWTKLVLQLSQQEPAVRHAVLAISSLYECFDIAINTAEKNTFALQHYNGAIEQLMHKPDETVILIVCVLMVCVEFLQGNVQTAIQHCRHGITILNHSSIPQSTRDQLLPIFCRLGIFPFFFGRNPSNFPILEGLKLPSKIDLSCSSVNIDQLQYALEVIIYRSVRFICVGNDCRLLGHRIIAADVLDEQRLLEDSLNHWSKAFSRFENQQNLSAAQIVTCHILEVKYLACVIWVNSALDFSDMTFDRHLDKFQIMVERSLALESIVGQPRHKFSFEMGFLPLLFFASISCRYLHTRVAALKSMRALSAMREFLWDVDLKYSIGKNVIFLEHGMSIDALDLIPLDPEESMNWSPPERRVLSMDVVMNPTFELSKGR